MSSHPPPALSTLASIFLRLGCTAFGGPAAHIAMMQREFVEQRGWITRERFLDLLGGVNLIPGPNSTELAISIGAELQGRRGLLVAGACFIAPAFSIVLLLAWFYDRYGGTPDLSAILAGVTPVVIAIIAQAFWNLAKTIASRPMMILLAVCVFVAGVLGASELVLLLGSGAAAMLIARFNGGKMEGSSKKEEKDDGPDDASPPRKRLRLFGGGTLALLLGAPSAGSIFLYFLYLGSILYGSGYVLIAFLRNDLVGSGSLGWLSERQLLDAVAIGQVTPGPLFTTATFIGYLLGGVGGSIAATAGIFLPSFIFVLLTHRWIARLRTNPVASAFLDGVNAGALALIGVALVVLGGETLAQPVAWGIALIALGVLIFTRVNPTWLIAGGGAVGWLLWG